MIERATTVGDLLIALGANLEARLAPYRRSTPEARSREMQEAAFGPGTEPVTEEEYYELADRVQKITAWLKVNGKTAKDHPDYRDSGKEVYWKKNEDDPDSPYICVELEPWGVHSGRNLEQSPAFTIETTDPAIQFELNFDHTYYLSVKPPLGERRFESSHLPRQEMTRKENEIVQNAIKQAASYFAIPL